MRNILLLSHAFPPDNTPAAIRPDQLYRYMPEHGFQPLVIASAGADTSHSELHVHRVPNGTEPPLITTISHLVRRLMRVAAPYNDRWPWAPYAAAAAANLLKSQRIEAVYSTSPFLASHFAALWLKKQFNLPWIADLQDPVRDNPFRQRKWVYPYDAIIERAIFSRADYVSANTDTVASMWRQRYPQWANKFFVSWNSFDPEEHFHSTQTDKKPYRVLAHIGSLYGGRHPSKLLTSLDRLGISDTVLRVKLVGPIDPQTFFAHKSTLERMRRSGVLRFENKLVPRQDALKETSEADYLLLLDLNEHNASFQVPSKLLDYIRSGNPIIAYTPENSPVERILARSGIPHVAIDPRAPDTISDEKIVEFLQIPPEKHQASYWFEANFSAKALATSTATKLNALLPTKTSKDAVGTPALADGTLSKITFLPPKSAPPVSDSLNSTRFPCKTRPWLITTVDAEEEFDWSKPLSHEARNVSAMSAQRAVHRIYARYNIVPLYLVTYPIVANVAGSAFLTECLKDGKCQVGAQLHSWVTPPFDEIVNLYNSFACNLPPSLEFAKLKTLTEAIADRFGVRPTTYRAGRYGIGPNTVQALCDLGYQVDSSVVPEHTYQREGGPTFLGYSNTPYWLDPRRQLMELPVTAGFTGPVVENIDQARKLIRPFFERDDQYALGRSIMARSRLVERIRLTPEGTSIVDAKRLVRSLLKGGTTVFTLSYHAPSLVPGNTPYVRSSSDRDRFLNWFDDFYDFFFGEIRGIPVSISDIYTAARRSIAMASH